MPLDLEKYANLLVNYSTQIKAGDKVLVWGDVSSEPIVREIVKLIAQKNAHPWVKIDLDDQDYLILKYSSKEALKFEDPFMMYTAENMDALIMFRSITNTRIMANQDPEKIAVAAAAKESLYAKFFMRAAMGEIRWVVAPYPTDGAAQEANMSKEELTNLIRTTCFLDKDDPAAEWQKLCDQQQIFINHLNKVSELRIVSEGTNLTMSVAGRKWINCAGRENMPDGEIFTGPVEESVNGEITFSYPSVADGKDIRGIKFTFKDGKITKASAEEGEDILHEKLKIPGANQVGEIAIGTNWAHTKHIKEILFDEKMGGTVHLAIGRGYPETGSKAMSGLHWDLLCNMHSGQIFADGKLIYENGRFLI